MTSFSGTAGGVYFYYNGSAVGKTGQVTISNQDQKT
jgi:hypothetical protein